MQARSLAPVIALLSAGALLAPTGAAATPLPPVRLLADPQPLRLGTSLDGLAFTPDGRHLVASSYLGEIAIWDVASLGEPVRIDSGTSVVDVLATDRTIFVLAGSEPQVARFDLAGQPLAPIRLGFEPQRISVDAAARTLVASGPHSALTVIDLARGARRRLASSLAHVACLTVSPDGRWLAAGYAHTTELWDLPARRRVRVIDGPLPSARNHDVYAFANDALVTAPAHAVGPAVAPDGRIYAALADGLGLTELAAPVAPGAPGALVPVGPAVPLRASGREPDASLTSAPAAIAASRDHVALGMPSGVVRLFRRADLAPLDRSRGSTEEVVVGAWDPAGRWVAVGGKGPLVHVWRLPGADGRADAGATADEPMALDSGSAYVEALAVDDPGARWSAGADVIRWDARTGRELGRCPIMCGALALAPDGTMWGTSPSGLVRFDPDAGRCATVVAPLANGSPFELAAGDVAIFPFTCVRRERVDLLGSDGDVLSFAGDVALARGGPSRDGPWAFEWSDDAGRWWSLAGATPRAYATVPIGRVGEAFMSRDGARFVTSGEAITLFALGPGGPRLLTSFDRPARTRVLALSPDASQLLVVRDDVAPGIVRLGP
ncbi:MAG: hypothetical protein U1F43_12335 [Myxococcota bacterium]